MSEEPYDPLAIRRPSRVGRAITTSAWVVWAGLTVWQAWFVLTFTGDMAFRDEVQLSPWVYGDRPITPQWLWAQHFEHRIPVSKSIYLLVMALTDDHYRAVALCNVVLLSAGGALLLRQVRRLNGASWVDVLIPLALGTLAHWQNLISGFQIQFTVTIFLLTCILIGLTRRAVFDGYGTVTAIACPLILLPLSGAQGLMIAVVIASWLGVTSMVVGLRRTPDARGPARLATWCAAVTLTLCALYLVDLTDPFASQRTYTFARMIDGVVGVLSTTFGPAGTSSAAFAVPAGLIVAMSVIAPLVAWKRQRIDAPGASAMVSVALALALLVLTMGVGRASIDPSWARWPRYSTITAGLLLQGVLVLRLCTGPLTRNVVGAVTLGLMLAMFVPNTSAALAAGRERATLYESIRADARDGTPVDVLTSRYAREINPLPRTRATFERMRRSGTGPWRDVPPSVTRTIPEEFDARSISVASELGRSPLYVDVYAGRRTWAIVLHARLVDPKRPGPTVRVEWTTPAGRRGQDVRWSAKQHARTVWVDAAPTTVSITSLNPASRLVVERVDVLSDPETGAK